MNSTVFGTVLMWTGVSLLWQLAPNNLVKIVAALVLILVGAVVSVQRG